LKEKNHLSEEDFEHIPGDLSQKNPGDLMNIKDSLDDPLKEPEEEENLIRDLRPKNPSILAQQVSLEKNKPVEVAEQEQTIQK